MCCVLPPEVIFGSLSFLTGKCGIRIRRPLPGAWVGLVFKSAV